ncbi:zinc finger protein 26 [Bombyx mori]|uniref:zinc finger protein 26 n=1 Tax=Bombyx mori TaxID=7091 RepID=UPI002ED162CB
MLGAVKSLTIVKKRMRHVLLVQKSKDSQKCPDYNKIEKRNVIKDKLHVLRESGTELLLKSTLIPFRWLKSSFRCFYCYEIFKEPRDLKAHQTTHQDPEIIKKTMNKYWESVIYVDVSNIGCRLCSEQINDLDSLIEHSIRKHKMSFNTDVGNCIRPFRLEDMTVNCVICGKNYTNFSFLLIHTNKEHFGLSPLLCDVCGQHFKSKRLLRDHVAHDHEKKPVECNICGETIVSMTRMRTHLQKAHNKRYRCLFCAETFENHYRRTRHMITIHKLKEEFKCPHCSLSFVYRNRLLTHIREKHLREKNVMCSVCGWEGFGKTSLGLHMKKHSDERNHPCPSCDKAFKTRKNMIQHLRNIHQKGRSRNFDKESASIVDAELVEAKKSWRVLATVLENSTAMPFKRHGNWHKCFFCGKRFQSVLHLRAHNTDQHSAESTNELEELITDPFINLDITSLRCRLCDAAADSLGDFIYHIREKHELNQITFVPRNILCFKLTDTDFSCLNCGRKFKLFGTLLSHIITEHNRLTSSNEIIPYKNDLDDSLHIRKHECTFCRKRFLSRRRKELHVRLVHESKTNCPYCAETFRSTKDKDGHIYTVHSDEISWQSCDKCPAKFRLHEQLHKHTRRVHLKEKNVTCEVCGMRFFNNGILNMHKVRHSDAKPFQCSICHKHFARKAAMKLHMRIHTNERRYICKLCGKAFVQWSSLQLHLPRHSDERKFRCMVCSKAFKTKNNLKKHSSNVHGKDKVA